MVAELTVTVFRCTKNTQETLITFWKQTASCFGRTTNPKMQFTIKHNYVNKYINNYLDMCAVFFVELCFRINYFT